jgi:hypothetical protein
MPTDIDRTISQQAHEAKQRELAGDCGARQETRLDLIQRYLHLTRTIMPALAQKRSDKWPVRNDHCFQRIVLDAVCGGVWYDFVSRPAYRHLNLEQAQRAVHICKDIIAGRVDLADLNQKSLSWRGKRAHQHREI